MLLAHWNEGGKAGRTLTAAASTRRTAGGVRRARAARGDRVRRHGRRAVGVHVMEIPAEQRIARARWPAAAGPDRLSGAGHRRRAAPRDRRHHRRGPVGRARRGGRARPRRPRRHRDADAREPGHASAGLDGGLWMAGLWMAGRSQAERGESLVVLELDVLLGTVLRPERLQRRTGGRVEGVVPLVPLLGPLDPVADGLVARGGEPELATEVGADAAQRARLPATQT